MCSSVAVVVDVVSRGRVIACISLFWGGKCHSPTQHIHPPLVFPPHPPSCGCFLYIVYPMFCTIWMYRVLCWGTRGSRGFLFLHVAVVGWRSPVVMHSTPRRLPSCVRSHFRLLAEIDLSSAFACGCAYVRETMFYWVVFSATDFGLKRGAWRFPSRFAVCFSS